MYKSLLYVVSLCAIFNLAHADELADVKQRGTLICGVFSGAEPFAFQDVATRETRGYDIDICRAVATHLGVKPEYKVVSLDARIPELQQGRVDVLAALLGYTPARATQITFSNAYFVSEQKLAARKADGYKTTGDLSGKRIGSVKGSSNVAMVRKALPTSTSVSFDDASTGFMALLQGKVDGFVGSEASLRRLGTRLGGPNAPVAVLNPPVGNEYWGLGLRNDEPAFTQAVNGALVAMEKSGELDQIFNQWLGPKTEYQMKRSFTVSPIPR